jgi:hypothetical protein
MLMVKKVRRNKSSDDFLDGLEKITVVLENDKHIQFSIATEIGIPESHEAQIRALRSAPSRMMFWSYQAERALKAVRDCEDRIDEVAAEKYLLARDHIVNTPQWDTTKPTESLIRSIRDQQSEVIDLKEKLSTLREGYGILRSLKEACEHRCFALRKLLSERPLLETQ